MSKSNGGPIASQELLLGIELIERLEEEKKGITDDIKDVYSEYKGRGFDTKSMREIIKLRKLTPEVRREREALLDTYKAALGMLDGTPLGKWAVERLKKDDEPKPAIDPEAPPPSDGELGEPAEDQEPVEPPVPELTVEEARAAGHEAAHDGRSVTANPFPAFDDRRAAWDEAGCAALGSDGMEIPHALKPAGKAKKAEPAADPEGSEDAGDDSE